MTDDRGLLCRYAVGKCVTVTHSHILRLRGFIEESVDENILSSNRLSSVEAEYMIFYDHHRMDAIDCISDLRVKKENSKWIEIENQRIACMVFEVK